MTALIIYGMVFIGSALMVYNIYTYVHYLRYLLEKNYWESGRHMLYFPLVLLIMFLIGYLLVGMLREAGCELVQGFYFSRPLPAEEFEELIRKEIAIDRGVKR